MPLVTVLSMLKENHFKPLRHIHLHPFFFLLLPQGHFMESWYRYFEIGYRLKVVADTNDKDLNSHYVACFVPPQHPHALNVIMVSTEHF